METLDVEDGFSVHAYRHGLKLLRQGAEATTLSNREGFGCPACGREFDRVLVANERSITFDSAPPGPLCVVRAGETLLVLTH